MHLAVAPNTSYEIEIACTCDRLIEQLPPPTTLELSRRLRGLAELALLVPLPSRATLRHAGIDAALRFTVDSLVVVYEVSTSRRVLTVLDIVVNEGDTRAR